MCLYWRTLIIFLENLCYEVCLLETSSSLAVVISFNALRKASYCSQTQVAVPENEKGQPETVLQNQVVN